jgi:hypothetical protein
MHHALGDELEAARLDQERFRAGRARPGFVVAVLLGRESGDQRGLLRVERRLVFAAVLVSVRAPASAAPNRHHFKTPDRKIEDLSF